MSNTILQHRPRKRFGQNFLRDGNIVQRIIDAINPQPNEHLLEIGPGEGALTEGLVQSGAKVDVIELDRDLVPGLLAAYGLKPEFRLHNADVLKFDISSLSMEAGMSLRVVGNLPYNISTPLIVKLLTDLAPIADMHFMLQKEVVQRLAAAPGNKLWGRLGVLAQYKCQVEDLFEVPPEAFRPPPKVHSAIVRLTPLAVAPYVASSEETLRLVVQASFAQRRKTLRNNLKGIIDSAALETLHIDPRCRAETLTIEQFVAIANAIDDSSCTTSEDQACP